MTLDGAESRVGILNTSPIDRIGRDGNSDGDSIRRTTDRCWNIFRNTINTKWYSDL